jgi:hypothetical protein
MPTRGNSIRSQKHFYNLTEEFRRERRIKGGNRNWRLGRRTKETMKISEKLCLAAALAATFSVVNTSSADEGLLSPRARSNQISKATGVDTGPDLNRTRPPLGNARASELFPSRAMSNSASDNDVDLVHTGRPFYSGKNPIWESDENRQFEIAPLVNKGKTCEAGCAKDCCAKK